MGMRFSHEHEQVAAKKVQLVEATGLCRIVLNGIRDEEMMLPLASYAESLAVVPDREPVVNAPPPDGKTSVQAYAPEA
jgi:hypothetical protein